MYVISFDQYTLINFGDGVPISTMENGNIYVSSYVAMRYPLINIHTMGSPYLQMENGEDILINKFWGIHLQWRMEISFDQHSTMGSPYLQMENREWYPYLCMRYPLIPTMENGTYICVCNIL